jgi:hypothetical protein
MLMMPAVRTAFGIEIWNLAESLAVSFAALPLSYRSALGKNLASVGEDSMPQLSRRERCDKCATRVRSKRLSL